MQKDIGGPVFWVDGNVLFLDLYAGHSRVFPE